jgi:hypothetical protein
MGQGDQGEPSAITRKSLSETSDTHGPNSYQACGALKRRLYLGTEAQSRSLIYTVPESGDPPLGYYTRNYGTCPAFNCEANHTSSPLIPSLNHAVGSVDRDAQSLRTDSSFPVVLPRSY